METTSTHDSDSSTNSNTSIILPDGSNSNSYYDEEDDDDDHDHDHHKDIIMLHATSVSYTSLKDIMHGSHTSTNIMSPSAATANNNSHSSFYEIPIKNHLVKQAALAYLTPMSSPKPAGGSRWFDKFAEFFCCLCGRFGWIKEDGDYDGDGGRRRASSNREL